MCSPVRKECFFECEKYSQVGIRAFAQRVESCLIAPLQEAYINSSHQVRRAIKELDSQLISTNRVTELIVFLQSVSYVEEKSEGTRMLPKYRRFELRFCLGAS